MATNPAGKGTKTIGINMKKDIWILAEQKDGELSDITFCLLAEGKRIGKALKEARL